MANSDYRFVKSVYGTDIGLGGPTGDEYVTGSADIDLFPDVQPSEASAGVTHYRCFYVRYAGSAEATNCKIWFPVVNVDVGTIEVGTGDMNTEAPHITAPGTTPPPGVAFSNITNFPDRDNGLEVGSGSSSSMTSGDYRAIWLKRTIPAGSAGDPSEQYRITFGGESTS